MSQPTQNQSNAPRRSKVARKARSYTLHYILLVIFCAAVALVLCYTVFFKVQKIQVEGCTYYNEQEVIDLVGVKKGDKLMEVSVSAAQKQVTSKLPFIRDVKIRRKFPTTLVIEVVEEDLMGAAYTEDGYAMLSTTGKVMMTSVTDLPDNLPVVFGLEEYPFEENEYVLETDPEILPKDRQLLPQITSLQEVEAALTALEMNGADYIDVTSEYNITMLYDGRLLVKLGTPYEMEQKLNFLKKGLENYQGQFDAFQNFEGEVDLTNATEMRTREQDIDRIKDPRIGQRPEHEPVVPEEETGEGEDPETETGETAQEPENPDTEQAAGSDTEAETTDGEDSGETTQPEAGDMDTPAGDQPQAETADSSGEEPKEEASQEEAPASQTQQSAPVDMDSLPLLSP